MNKTIKKIEIPQNVRIVFIFSTGQKQFLNAKYFGELSEIFSWMLRRSVEFQEDIFRMSGSTLEGTFSILELDSSGNKNILMDLNHGDYSLYDKRPSIAPSDIKGFSNN